MPPPMLPLCRLTLALSCALAAGGVRAELIKISPFLPPQSAGNTPTSNAPLEYRGVMEIGNVEQYRVVDPAKKVGSWLKVGERDANIDVYLKQHDSANESVVVEHGGQTMTLALKTAKVASSGMAAPVLPPPPSAAPAPNVSPAVLQTVVPNPTAADEQRRLEAVAAEVARRRALREQAAAQAQQQQPGMPVPQPNMTRQDLQQAQPPVQPGRPRGGMRQP